MDEFVEKVDVCAECERRYDCVYEGIDVEQYTAQLIGKMKKWGSLGVVRNRSTLASQVVCERFELVVLVFSRWILPHTSLSLSQWFVTILNGVLEPLKQAQECEKLLLVARPILATFVEGGENTDNTSQCLDALAAQIPFLFSHIASADKEQIASVFTFLLKLRPSLFESLRELFVASLSTLQSPATPAVFGVLSSMKVLFPAEVYATLKQSIARLLTTYNTEPVRDVSLLRVLMEQITLFLVPNP